MPRPTTACSCAEPHWRALLLEAVDEDAGIGDRDDGLRLADARPPRIAERHDELLARLHHAITRDLHAERPARFARRELQRAGEEGEIRGSREARARLAVGGE